ncbi:MAG TPA: type II secretion system protein N [Burkholderiaceae bacterium]|jgi:general secretion pathway protein C|nr:type II secretion system protein N [Burkholderiaceae bacterium]
MSSRWIGFFVWALVAACLAFWGLKIFAATHPVPAGALTPVPPVATAGAMDRLFGAAPTAQEDEDQPAPESDRYQLVGVIAPNGGGQGFAIVSIDSQPAKAWHVGAALEGATTLLAVAKRSADFGPTGGPSAFTLELPPPASAQTGTLPGPVSQPYAAATPVNRGIGGQANAAQLHNPREGQFLGNHPAMRPLPGGVRPGGFQPQPGGMPTGANVVQPQVQAPAGREQPDSGDDNTDE